MQLLKLASTASWKLFQKHGWKKVNAFFAELKISFIILTNLRTQNKEQSKSLNATKSADFILTLVSSSIRKEITRWSTIYCRKKQTKTIIIKLNTKDSGHGNIKLDHPVFFFLSSYSQDNSYCYFSHTLYHSFLHCSGVNYRCRTTVEEVTDMMLQPLCSLLVWGCKH